MQGEGSLYDFEIGLLDGSGVLSFSDYEGMVSHSHYVAQPSLVLKHLF